MDCLHERTSAWSFSATVISFYASNAAAFLQAWVAKLADATDLKSVDPKGSCGFDSRPRHHASQSVSNHRYIERSLVPGTSTMSLLRERSFTFSKIARLSWVSSPCPLELPGLLTSVDFLIPTSRSSPVND